MQVGKVYASSFGDDLQIYILSTKDDLVEYILVSYGEIRSKSWINAKNLKGFVVASEEVSSAVTSLVTEEAMKRVEEAARGLQEGSKEKG